MRSRVPGESERVASEQEGVLQFDLTYCASDPFQDAALPDLNAWRRILFLTRLIGRDPGRYHGFDYGNVSVRLSGAAGEGPGGHFLISGTRTAGVSETSAAHYTLVTECHPLANQVKAAGPVKPSSETMTHAMLYQMAPAIRCVLHVHSPEIWSCREALQLPCTRDKVPYGTAQMAMEIKRLFNDSGLHSGGVLAMGGHEDGVIAFGATVEEAGVRLLSCLGRATALTFRL